MTDSQIMDLEITNASLLAINQTLVRRALLWHA